MKQAIFVLFVTVVVNFGCYHPAIDTKQTINPIIGDISFILKFGHQPNAHTDEDLRIKTHLEYIENLLRQKDVAGLPPELRQKRIRLLNFLHNYVEAGIFPRNYDEKENRAPCFIDKDNRICAVGYLVEKTAGRQIAEDINTKHKYDKILAMNDKTVDRWIETSGFSKEECAMIQPTYGPVPAYSYNYIAPAYGISSAVLGGVNLSLNIINGIQISKGTNNKTVATIGLLSGAWQTILGAAKFPKTTNGYYGNTTNESRKTLSMVNIGLGTTTLILSTWNLITHKKPKEKKIICNLNSFETQDTRIGVALNFKLKL